MRLGRISIRRMPGIDSPFSLEELSHGLNLIVGPNGSGKSSLCRAIRALLWPEAESSASFDLTSQWSGATGRVRIDRERDQIRWRRDGVDVTAPELPGSHLAHCFTLGVRDLLLESDATDDEIAREILRRMSGGYDIGEVSRELFPDRPNIGRHEDGRLRDVTQRLAAVRREQADLAEREGRLGRLKAELDDARRSGRELETLRKVERLARARASQEQIDRDLAGFPAGMDRLTGDELERLAQLDDDLRGTKREMESSRALLAEAEREREACRLPDGPLDDATLNAQAEKGRELRESEREIRAARARLAEAEERVRSALERLDADADPDRLPRLDARSRTALDTFLRRSVALGARRARVEARLEARVDGDPGLAARRLERAADSLRTWLAASQSVRPARMLGISLAAASALAAGVILGFEMHWGGWLLAGTGLGVLLATWILIGVRGWMTKAGARRRVEELGVDSPEAWRPAEVREACSRTEAALADARLDQRRQERGKELERELRALETEEREHEAERERLRSDLGVDLGRPDLDLAVLASELLDCRRAGDAARAARAELEMLQESRDALLAEVNRLLGMHGARGGGGLLESVAAIDDLKDRCARYRATESTRRRESDHGRRLADRAETLERRRGAVFEQAGLPPGGRRVLEQRLSGLDRYRELTEQARSHRTEIQRAERELEARRDLRSLSLDQIEERVGEAGQRAARRDELNQEIGTIRGRVAQARKTDRLERLLAEAAAADERLRERLEEKLRSAAGEFLLGAVREEHRRTSRPEMLARAEELFGTFTSFRYELLLDTESEPPAFCAREVSSGLVRSLTQLSDGTRVQLLLAARLAFASRLDAAERLPLFLDEALTTSDPERFEAIARSLLVTVEREGRQVFYLTSNPVDADRWNALLRAGGEGPVRIVDLAEIRGLAAAATEVTELVAAPLPQVPLPEGRSPEEYALALRVPPLNPREPVSAVHLFHLLPDELALLHELLSAGIATVGQWRRLEATGRVTELFGEGAASRLEAMAELVESFIEAWRIGRGRPLDVDLLRDAGVTALFLERLTPLVAELDGDAERLVRALEERTDDRAKKFRRKTLDDLRAHLIAEGCLDPRETLDEERLVAHVMAAVADRVAEGVLTTTEVASRVSGFARLPGAKSGL